MNPFEWLLVTVVWLYIYMLIGQAILSLLISFNIVNSRQPLVAGIGEFLYRVTEPVLGPVRRALPNLGPIDISPMVVIIALLFALRMIQWIF